jgi:hypothetical protein
MLPLIVGVAAVVLVLVGGGIAFVISQSGQPTVAKAPGKGGGKVAAAKDSGKLVLDWPEEDRKNGFAVIINDKRQLTLTKGELAFDLKPGDHKVLLQRRGFAHVEATVSVKQGETTTYKPTWTKDEFGAAGAAVATKTLKPENNSGGTDFQVGRHDGQSDRAQNFDATWR